MSHYPNTLLKSPYPPGSLGEYNSAKWLLTDEYISPVEFLTKKKDKIMRGWYSAKTIIEKDDIINKYVDNRLYYYVYSEGLRFNDNEYWTNAYEEYTMGKISSEFFSYLFRDFFNQLSRASVYHGEETLKLVINRDSSIYR
jgi:hypothetical protein